MRAIYLPSNNQVTCIMYLNSQVVDDFGNIVHISGDLFTDTVIFEYSDRSPMLGTDLCEGE